MLVVVAYESMFGNTRQVAQAITAGLVGGPGAPDVECRPAAQVPPELIAHAALLVVGGPTHYHGLASRNSLIAGRQLQRRAVLTGNLRPHGLAALGELASPHVAAPDVAAAYAPGRVVPAARHAPGAAVEPAAAADAAAEEPGASGDEGLPLPARGGDVDLRAWLRTLSPSGGALAAAFDTRLASRWAGGAAYAIARRLRHRGYHPLSPPAGYLIDGLLGPLRDGELARAEAWGGVLRRQLRA